MNYGELIGRLHSIPFEVILEKDNNRAIDGTDLRLYFCGVNNYEDAVAYEILDGPCSVLEMLVAFARRIESDVMWNPEIGDRSHVWFWLMIDNLGLTGCDNEHYDEEKDDQITHVIDNFMGRRYFKDGFGGLFPLKKSSKDQRKIELWYQMQAFFIENYV